MSVSHRVPTSSFIGRSDVMIARVTRDGWFSSIDKDRDGDV